MKLNSFLRTLLQMFLGAIIFTVLLACWPSISKTMAQSDAPTAETGTTASVASSPSANSAGTAMANDYYTVTGPARRPYQVKSPGVVQYCPLDHLDRAVCAYGELTSSLRDAAQRRGRQELDVDPAGWPEHNGEVTIAGLPGVKGSRSYHGWMFNRSHLLADSLGGDAVHQNLVTGTRTQNVGSTQVHGEYAGGMAYTESIAREYLDRKNANSCPLYYAVTPNYVGNELIPRTIAVDMRSCDAKINTHVMVYNTAQGYTITYTNGSFAATR